MKRLLTNFLTFSSVGLLMLASCKKNDKEATDAGSQAGALSTTTTNLVLQPSMASDTSAVITFNFTAPKITFKTAALKDQLQVDVPSDNWKSPTAISVSTSATSQGFSTAVFDKLLLGLKLPVGVSTKVNVRLSNGLSTESALYSNVITITVTPINLASFLYVVGSYQGWNLANRDSLISPTSNGIYSGIIDFTPNNPDFLILPDAGDYNNKYATNDPINTTSANVAVGANNNFYSPAGGGYYIVTIDINKNTITFVASDYYSVTGNEVVGGDWGVDQFMKFVNDGSNTWTATLNMAPVANGGFKIRYDAQWTYSWGPPQAASVGGGQTGVLADDKDDNLAVTAAGNYTTTITAAPTSYGATPLVLIPYTFSGK